MKRKWALIIFIIFSSVAAVPLSFRLFVGRLEWIRLVTQMPVPGWVRQILFGWV